MNSKQVFKTPAQKKQNFKIKIKLITKFIVHKMGEKTFNWGKR